MGGIWLQSFTSHAIFLTMPSLLAIIIILMLLSLLKKIHWDTLVRYSLFACAFSGGVFLYNNQESYYDNFYEQIAENSSYDLIGTVTDIQQLQQKHYSHLITVNKNHFLNNKQPPISVDWSVTLYANACSNIRVGDTILFSNVRIKKQKNSSSTFKYYLIKQNIITTIFLPKNFEHILLYRPQFSINRSIFNKKMELYNRLKSKMARKTFTFFSSLFLGNKQHNYFQEQLREQFKFWGLSHYLARSGLHLIIFIFLWKLFLCFLPLPYLIKKSALILIALIYFLLSWSSTSFLRAFFSFLLYCLFLLFNQQINGLHLLSLVTFVILILNPTQLFFLDFQLSFSLTFALIWFNLTQSHFLTNKQK